MSRHGNWRRPSGCANTECVEVRVDEDVVMVRSSKRPELIAMFDLDEWAAHVAAVKAGEYDDLTGSDETVRVDG